VLREGYSAREITEKCTVSALHTLCTVFNYSSLYCPVHKSLFVDGALLRIPCTLLDMTMLQFGKGGEGG
jgi:hypothetical protein